MLVDVVLRSFHHRDQDCIGIFFSYNQKVNSLVKTIPGLMYSKTHKCWYVSQRNGLVDEIENVLKTIAKLDTSELADNVKPLSTVADSAPEEEQQLLRLMQQKLHLKGYADSTSKTYLEQFKLFLQFYRPASVVDLSETDIRNYILYLIEKRKLSKSTQNTAINAVKFFFEKVLGEERKVYHIERPMKDNRLPSVLSEEEIIEIFSVITNLKHRLMLMIIYSAGLRRSELINLRKSDVNVHRGTVLIKGGKGRKDRQSILAQSLTPAIMEYLEKYKPVYWMFEGLAKQKYSATSLQVIFKRALKEAGISKDVHLHTLRHSFATHLLESGTSTRYIQELLGHESSQTTELYTRVTRFSLDKIKSPLDKIVQQKRLKDGED